jgi:hypothetical protein
VNGNYSPDNCTWVCRRSQVNNLRRSRLLEGYGIQLTVSEWGSFLGFDCKLLDDRINHLKKTGNLEKILKLIFRDRQHTLRYKGCICSASEIFEAEGYTEGQRNYILTKHGDSINGLRAKGVDFEVIKPREKSYMGFDEALKSLRDKKRDTFEEHLLYKIEVQLGGVIMSKNNFSTQKFTVESESLDTTEVPKKEFVRDDSDNKIFSGIQVKDIREIITEDCIGHWDADTMIWKACANMENKYIKVTHKDEGWTEEFSNVSTFRGLGSGIKEKSWLGLKNMDRGLEGLPPWKLEDFEIENCAKLKYEFDKAVEQAKVQIYTKIKNIKEQFRVNNIKLHTGSGDCFRHELDLVRPYKGERSPDRPLLLKTIREWVAKDLPHESTREGFEADDRCEHMGYLGYLNWLKTGKFSHLTLSSDKDAKSNAPKLLIDPDTYTGENNPLKGKYKFPQALLIKDSSKDVGEIAIIQKEKSVDYKFYGFVGLLWQAFCSGDGADNYNCLTHLKQNLNFGDESAYKLLKPCKTAKEALQATLDKFFELLPYGVQYVSHKGEALDVDTMTYMNTYFLVAYMTRSYEDNMDFKKLCDAMRVDYSKLVDNNKFTPPIKTFVGNEDHLKLVGDLLESILKEDMKGCKQLKSTEKNDLFDRIKEKLESINFESHYEMKQFTK